MSNTEKIKRRALDFVFCIDTTKYMAPHLEKIKSVIKKLGKEIVEHFAMDGSEIEQLRYKIITFSDYKIKHSDAIVESLFFEIPHDEPQLELFLDSIEPNRDCWEGSNAYEALVYAMRSGFVTGPNDRQIIVLFTDEKVIPLRSRCDCEGYPEDMPDMEGLHQTWMCQSGYETHLRERLKRMLVLAPPISEVKSRIVDEFNRCIYEPVEYNEGFDENLASLLFFTTGPK